LGRCLDSLKTENTLIGHRISPLKPLQEEKENWNGYQAYGFFPQWFSMSLPECYWHTDTLGHNP